MRKRRTFLQLIAEYLEAGKTPRLKTDFLYEAKVSMAIHSSIFNNLVKAGLLSKTDDRYVTTEKGYEWLEAWQKLMEMLGEIP